MSSTLQVVECSAEEYVAALARVQSDESISFLQAPFYGAWQTQDGKAVVYFSVNNGEATIAAGLAIQYDAPGGLSFLYCPYGPVTSSWTPQLVEALRDFFSPIARRCGAAFVRLDSSGLNALERPIANQLAITASLQPRKEWLLDISGDQETIWMALHKHARYNVRLAERAHARLDFYAPAEAPLDTFFSLMQTTAGRDSFSIQSRKYYEAVLGSVPTDSGFVVICTIDGKPAAVALFAAYDGVMHYVFAASSDEFRKIAPPYFVIWNAILEAKKRGWNTLNFGGITDEVKGTHLDGVTAFKKRFGGYEVAHSNPVDFVYKPVKYTLFKLYKTISSR